MDIKNQDIISSNVMNSNSYKRQENSDFKILSTAVKISYNTFESFLYKVKELKELSCDNHIIQSISF